MEVLIALLFFPMVFGIPFGLAALTIKAYILIN